MPNTVAILKDAILQAKLKGQDAADKETYVTTFAYDEFNRLIEQHIRGLNGNSIDHAWFFAYEYWLRFGTWPGLSHPDHSHLALSAGLGHRQLVKVRGKPEATRELPLHFAGG